MNERLTEINFVDKSLASWPQEKIELVKTEGIDKFPEFFKTGIDVWIIQSYILLHDSERFNVCISSALKKNCVNVIHRSQVSAKECREFFVVSVRADRDPLVNAHIEIVQNRSSVWSPRHLFIPHWPQPGLIKRDVNRRESIENVSFFGKSCHLSDEFKTTEFSERLSTLSCKLQIHEKDWWDYSKTDIVLAFREGYTFYLNFKPASKLVNAWNAGVPAILGKEAAYRELKTTCFDYIEIASAEDALAHIKYLKSHPEVYRRMIENGRQKANMFSRNRIRELWLEKLELIEDYYSDFQSKNNFMRFFINKSGFCFLVSCVRQRVWGWQAGQFPIRPSRYYFGVVRTFLVFPRIILAMKKYKN